MTKQHPKIDQRYEVQSNLGGGLSGEVLLVKDPQGQLAALKFLKKVQLNVSREDALKSFKNEFEILKQLNHPNISPILDFGFDSKFKKYYFTCEFIKGAEFHTACENQSFESIEKLIVQVLRALNYLHSRGIYHFDIKPQNILVGMDGNTPIAAKIIDFGLAGFSSPDKKVGTPAYMAPEVIQGGLLDGRTDLYSTGVLIYRVLTGQNPFASRKLKETLENQVKLKPTPPSELNPEVPKYWDHIVARLLEKKPIDRYSQASLVIRDLNFLSGKKFDVETKDTKLSYLPEKGTLIGRDEQWKTFTDMFEDIFISESSSEIKTLIIEGNKGSGKTRLLNEAKYYAQLRSVSVKSISQLESEESDSPFILLIDSDLRFKPDKINSILHDIKQEQFMIIWATEEAPKKWQNATTITLKNYDEAQLKQYIESVTGLDSAPDQLISEVYHRTLGNPLFVTEFIKSILDEGLLFDDSGKWDAKTFGDIEIDFNKIHIPNSVEDQLTIRFKKLNQDAQNILKWLATNQNPLTIEQLGKVTKNDNLANKILELVENDVIEKTEQPSGYYFKNLLFANIICKTINDTESATYHDNLAELYTNDAETKPNFLFHIGHGSHIKEAKTALYELGNLHLQNAQEDLAIDTFNRLFKITDDNFGSLEIKSYFKLGRANINQRHYDKAIEWYQTLKNHIISKTDSENKELCLKAYNHITECHLKKEDLTGASKAISEALEVIPNSPHILAYQTQFNNHRAHVLMKQGSIEEAESIYKNSQNIWENDLNDDEKDIVNNNRLIEIFLLKQENEMVINLCLDNIKSLKSGKNKYQLALQYYALGDVYYRKAIQDTGDDQDKDIEKSTRNFEACEKIAREIHDYGLMLRAFNGLGNMYTHSNSWDEALDYYNRALSVSQRLEEFWTASLISYNIGGIHSRLKNFKDAYSYLVYTINTLENTKEQRSPHTELNLFLSYMQIVEVHLHNKDIKQAFEAMDKADEYFDSTEILKVYEFWKIIRRAQILYSDSEPELADDLFNKAKALAKDQGEKEELETTVKNYKQSAVEDVQDDSSQAQGIKVMTIENQNQNTGSDNLKKIIEINKFINSEYDPKQLLKIVLNYAIQLSNAEAGFVLLLDEDGSFNVTTSMNTSESDEDSISMSVARMAIEKGEIITSSDALSDDRFDASESIVLNELKSVLCLPIRSKNRSIGVFYLDNKYKVNAFDESNVSLLNAFCDQVGIALENSKLINQLLAAQTQLTTKLEKTTEELAHVKDILKTESDAYKTKYAYNAIISRSEPMQAIFKLLDKVTETLIAVFIYGQSGTGKELVAKALHYNNPSRNNQRFIAINCGAIPENLMESELFGHKKGSFTGAEKDKKGLFEEANGGTIFLDEIGELASQLQVKLLRVLQEGEVQKVGDSQPISVDVRVISASHQDLETLVKTGNFREDLYYRLCQMKIDLPALKERTEDIPLLAKHFVDKFKTQNNYENNIEIPPVFMKALLEYTWPGNVRELENLISVACALREEDHLSMDNIPPNYGVKKVYEASNPSINSNLAHMSSTVMQNVNIDEHNVFDSKKTWQNYESVILAKAYELNDKKKMPTADCLGVSHSTIYKKISDMDLDETSNPLYADEFIYDKEITLKEYVVKVFSAALKFHNDHPYAAIKQLGISQGYFYKIMKQIKQTQTESESANVE